MLSKLTIKVEALTQANPSSTTLVEAVFHQEETDDTKVVKFEIMPRFFDASNLNNIALLLTVKGELESLQDDIEEEGEPTLNYVHLHTPSVPIGPKGQVWQLDSWKYMTYDKHHSPHEIRFNIEVDTFNTAENYGYVQTQEYKSNNSH